MDGTVARDADLEDSLRARWVVDVIVPGIQCQLRHMNKLLEKLDARLQRLEEMHDGNPG